MKSRIAIWAAVGALVVVFGRLYLPATLPNRFGIAWTLIDLVCPVSLARHYALSFYSVLLVNAVTYALIGMVVETIRRGGMKSRIAIWAAVGAFIVVFWRLYISISATFPNPFGIARTLIDLTCPAALVSHYALSFYSVLLVNAVTYALIGMVVETIRRQHQTRLLPN